MKNSLYIFFLSLIAINKAYSAEVYLEIDLCSQSNSTEVLIEKAIKGDLTAYKELELSSEFGRTEEFCMSECELFMYSLDIALETNNKRAFQSLYEIIERKYSFYNIEQNDLTRYLLDCFKRLQNVTPPKMVHNKIEWSENDLKYYDNINNFFHSILFEKDTIAYNTVSDTLSKNCGKEDFITSSYNISGYIVLSIIIADKYNSADAYYNVYRLIQDYYLTRGLNMGNKVYDFCVFFIERAAHLGNEKAIKILAKMDSR